MFKKYAMAGVLSSAMLAGAAFAQTTTTTTAPLKAAEPVSVTHAGTWRTSKIVGLSVYNQNAESLGSINDVLIDRSGDIKAVVIGVGGFLGVGEHLVAVSFDQLKFSEESLKNAAMAPPAGSAATRTDSTTSGAGTGTTATKMAPATAPSARNPWYPDHAVLNATKDQLKAMTEFKYTTN